MASDFMHIVATIVMFAAVTAFNVDTKNSLIFKGPVNSYFGYSVALLANSKGTWLLAGAPRANDSALPGVHEPGAVFHCNWQYRSSCLPIRIDEIGNEKQTIYKGKNITIHHNKNNMWLGASIDVNIHGDFKVMICAPRWKDQKFLVQDLMLMNGLCYEANRDLKFNENSAWPVFENYKKQILKSYFGYGMATLGMSSVYSRDGTFAVIGAPGLNDWSGGYAHIEPHHSIKPKILELAWEAEHDSYFGMSVTTAKLKAEDEITFIIIGGPRAGGHGKVFGYNTDQQLILVKMGEQLGSSFGSSVCAVDVNGDKLDDLVVGAPHYSDKMDEGRVYVFINREFFNLELMEPLLAGSNAIGARFGTAIANLGDINLDGYQDIAVGAPYEEGSGVVYIYNGDKSGLRSVPSQRIVGKSLGKDLKTFGWSFSRPWDVDGNHYADFAVGAFESNRVVLLRSRSVVDLEAQLEINPTLLDLRSHPSCMYRGQPMHCFKATICLKYTGQNLPPFLEINITLTVDTLDRHRNERLRLFIQGEGYSELESVNEILVTRLDYLNCDRKFYIFARKSRDVVTPLQINLAYDISSNSVGFASQCDICPIQNKFNPTKLHKQVYFALECGETCKPKLSIQAIPVFKNNETSLIIDNSPYFDLEVNILNAETADISYLTVTTLDYPTSLEFTTAKDGNVNVFCSSALPGFNRSMNKLTCDILSPIKPGQKVHFSARFYAFGVSYDQHKMAVQVQVASVANHAKENISLTIPIRIKAKMRLTGVSIPRQVTTYHDQSRLPVASDWVSLSHLYILSNLGPSPLPHGQLVLSVPTSKWIKLSRVQVESKTSGNSPSRLPIECNKLSDESGNISQERWPEETGTITYLQCDSMLCTNVTCYMGHMQKYETVYVNLSIEIHKNVLEKIKADQILHFVSMCQLREPSYLSYESLTQSSNATVSTFIMFKSLPSPTLSWWVLIISCSSGLLLLYICVILLWKCGFFKRKRKEELEMLMKYYASEREFPDTVSARSCDVMVQSSAIDSERSLRWHHFQTLPSQSSFFFCPDEEQQHLSYNDNYSLGQSPSQHKLLHDLSPFHTLQYQNNNNHRRGDRHKEPGETSHSRSTSSLQPNVWVQPPASPPPSFNNDLYLEPLESRA